VLPDGKNQMITEGVRDTTPWRNARTCFGTGRRPLRVPGLLLYDRWRLVWLMCCIAAPTLAASEHHGIVRFGGLPVPGATVSAMQGDRILATITDPDGRYSFLDLDDAVWTIRVEMLCFATLERQVAVADGAAGAEWDLELLAADKIALNRTVMAAPNSGASGQDPKQVKADRKPARDSDSSRDARPEGEARDSFQRAELSAAPDASAAAGAPQSASDRFTGQRSEDLAQGASDGFLISGSSNNSASSPFGLFPAFGNFRARRPGALYTGNVGLTLENSAFDARAFSLTGQNTPKPSYSRMTGVATFGGPLAIPHWFKNGPNIMLNYQWTRNKNATTQTGLMPTAAERGGDFAQTRTATGQLVRIFDPATGLQFPGSLIPETRISPQAKALLSLFPLPNFSGGSRFNYQVPVVGVVHQDSIQARVNKSVSRKDQLSGGFDYQSVRSDDPNLFGFLDKAKSAGLNTNIRWRRSFSTRLLVNFGYGYNRLAVRNSPFFAGRRNISGDAGVSGNSQDSVNWGPPDLVFSGGTTTLSDARPAFNRNQTNAFSWAMFWGRDRHNLSFGADFRRQQFNDLSQQNPRGTFTFTGAASRSRSAGSGAAGTGSDLADFILGAPDVSSIAFGNADKYLRASSYDGFFTDDWRINPGLTLNAGVRWEYGSPISELYGRLVNLDIARGFTAVVPVVGYAPVGSLTGTRYPCALIRPDRTGLQPRVGISWRPLAASSMIIRGGYGVYYNTSVYNTIALQMAQQPPLSKSFSAQNEPTDPLTLADAFNGSPSSTANTFAVDPNFRVGYVHSWQLSVQRDLPGALVMAATYLGSSGNHGTQMFLPNTYPTGAANPCTSCPAGYAYLASNGHSNRQAGQVQLRRRLRNGFTAELQYTFSKSIDDAALGGRGQGSPVIAQNWLDLRAERSLSSFDQRHLLNCQIQYTSGMGVAGGTLWGGWMGRLLKEWTFGTDLTAGSGLPLTPVVLKEIAGTGFTGTLRPDRTGAPIYAAGGGLFLNAAAYSLPADGHWGNAGRNSITGPAQFVLNTSIGRTLRARDRVAVDLRIDAANALNHVTFPGWNTNVASTQFGLPTTANSMRSVQTTLRAKF
jgi:trimeric autotransporter adhesin